MKKAVSKNEFTTGSHFSLIDETRRVQASLHGGSARTAAGTFTTNPSPRRSQANSPATPSIVTRAPSAGATPPTTI